MRIAVTGASGFVGRVVCEYLTQKDHDIVAISRNPNVIPQADNITMDLVENENLKEISMALAGCDAVIHTIGLAHMTETDEELLSSDFSRVNVDCAERIAKACLFADIRTLIYLSSVKAVGERSPNDTSGNPIPFNQHTDPMPEDAYGLSKLKAEDILEKILDNRNTRLVILRPPLVYGVGQKGNLAKLFDLVDAGIPLPLASITNKRSLISVNNLADAIATVLASSEESSGRYFVSDIELSLPELILEIGNSLKAKVRLIAFPLGLLALCAKFLGKTSEFNKVAYSLVVDDAKFREHYSWKPRFSYTDILQDIASNRRS